MKIKDKALRVVEALVSDDFMENMEMRELDQPIVASQEDIILMVKKLRMIYRFIHSTQEDHSCYRVHDDWRKELETVYKGFKKRKII